jgi:hypothetical protein
MVILVVAVSVTDVTIWRYFLTVSRIAEYLT